MNINDFKEALENKKIKKGDLVLKAGGHRKGEIGIVIETITNKYEKSIVTVATVVDIKTGEIKKWYTDFVEVIVEAG
mgnify:CR=1 FL=1